MIYEYRDNKDPELRERFENQNEFINGVNMFESFNPDATIEDFLQEVSLQTDIDQWEDSAEAVTLMTIHSAKGLEFRHVFIAGMEEGLFPLERTRLNPKELEEERRLFYVALTRAMEKVTITSAQTRMRFGVLMGATPSLFISEIPQEYISKDTIKRKIHFTDDDEPFFRQEKYETIHRTKEYIKKNEPVITPIKPPQPGSVAVGDKVIHKMFGKGKVRSISKRGGQVFLIIHFDNGVSKTIAEKFVEKI